MDQASDAVLVKLLIALCIVQEHQLIISSPMKLTPQVIKDAQNVISPEGKLTLVLRGLGIRYIENLDTTNDVYAIIDLTNNDIVELGGLPELENLHVLLLANNNISAVGDLPACRVSSLLLVNNNIHQFSLVTNLRKLPLTSLYMLGNPLADEHHYRQFLVWLVPSLRVLDGEKIKAPERAAATDLFGPSLEEATPAAVALLHGSKTVENVPKETRMMMATVKKLTKDDKAKLIQDLEKAQSMEEIELIQRALTDGYVA